MFLLSDCLFSDALVDAARRLLANLVTTIRGGILQVCTQRTKREFVVFIRLALQPLARDESTGDYDGKPILVLGWRGVACAGAADTRASAHSRLQRIIAISCCTWCAKRAIVCLFWFQFKRFAVLCRGVGGHCAQLFRMRCAGATAASRRRGVASTLALTNRVQAPRALRCCAKSTFFVGKKKWPQPKQTMGGQLYIFGL